MQFHGVDAITQLGRVVTEPKSGPAPQDLHWDRRRPACSERGARTERPEDEHSARSTHLAVLESEELEWSLPPRFCKERSLELLGYESVITH